MFNRGELWVFPTDTSFGLGARCDDAQALENIYRLKNRSTDKPLSLMCRDWTMLNKYAHVPQNLTEAWFFERPRTAILKPKKTLTTSQFWPSDKVAFRLCSLPEITQHIDVPISATSANLSGEPPIYRLKEARQTFESKAHYADFSEQLPHTPPSQIWDWTIAPPKQIR